MHSPDTRFIFHPRIPKVAGEVYEVTVPLKKNENFQLYRSPITQSPFIQAKMGMTEDFEASLQVLRGFDTDISAEVNEIKVRTSLNIQKQNMLLFPCHKHCC